ncbi:MAG: nitroreductase family protein [Desulfovibrio sp.]|nr:nitroreductase family protein [Desulfovibrio sp.]
MPRIEIDASKCLGDGLCAEACVAHCLKLEDGRAVVLPQAERFCIACGHCFAVCPAGAVSLDGTDSAQAEAADTASLAPDALARLVRSRRSLRRFADRKVPRELVEKALDAVRWAPTAVNRQDIGWIALDDPARIRALAACVVDAMRSCPGREGECRAFDAGRDVIFRDAPLVLFAHAPREPLGLQAQDCTIALTLLEHLFCTMGLGTTWAGYAVATAMQAPSVARFLGLGEDRNVFAGCMAGWPTIGYLRVPPRRPLRLTWI